MIDFLNDLNEAQLIAVKHMDGPSLIVAGAGAGKTRVLTYRIASLLSHHIKARSILALTFTNKAAREMKDRIARLVGDDVSRSLWMGTFHSIFARILRTEADKLGYPSTFTIYDAADSKSLVSSIIKELNLDSQIYKTNDVLGRISSAKNNLITPQAYSSNSQIRTIDEATRKPMIVEIYKVYSIRCKKSGSMDFDDLLLNTNILFRDFPEVLGKYQQIFNYILVDEYQDTNYSQYLIVNKLAAHHKNVCVVGDDAQSIYSFRGAKIENILNFKNDYPGYQLFKLEQNYRSTQTIVNAANSLISKNKGQIQKKVWSANDVGEKIKVLESETDRDEAFAISNYIFDTHLNRQANFSKFAVLYRTNAQSRIFEEALRKRNIPYRVYGSLSFYQRKEIKDILAYLRVIINNNDNEALKRIINYPARGIGDTTLTKIEEYANQHEIPLWNLISVPTEHQLEINKSMEKKLIAFSELLQSFAAEMKTTEPYDLALKIINTTGIINDLKADNTHENISRVENVEELLNSIREYADNYQEEGTPSLAEYMENVSLLTDADKENEKNKDVVSLMTIHAAKGLEFGYVCIAGMEESLFPSFMSVTNANDLEEERRLFYVALTRAEKEAMLSYALNRYKWGVPTNCNPSRFISEISPQYLDFPKMERQTEQKDESGYSDLPPEFKRIISKRPFIADPDFIPEDPALIKEGMNINHQSFGKGKVLKIDGVLPNAKATVVFEGGEEKKLLLKFARLKINND